ncbi:MAG: DEAD/DEAH box helicase family protein [Chlorobi bacterium]|nr:DEAD/DEAH box helicase family protein [Chlorobiota bacterium]
MASNFDFLKNTEWQELYDSARDAEKNTFTAPRVAAFFSRLTLENMIRWLYDNDEDLVMPYQTTLNSLMYEQSFKNIIPPSMLNNLTFIRKLGNNAVHQKSKPSSDESFASLKYLYGFLRWVYRTYSEDAVDLAFTINEQIIPSEKQEDKTKDEIQVLQTKSKEQQKEIIRAKKLLEQSKEEVNRLKENFEKYSKNKEQNKESKDHSYDYSEAETRELFINVLLREAGWDPKGKDVEEYEVTGMPNEPGIGYVDYVLWGDDGLPLAVVEAKKTKVDAHRGQHQAELYANCLENMFGRRPVIFYSNGYETWIWDDTFYAPREIQGFYTKDELNRLINRRIERKELSVATINKEIAGRYYQEEAIRRVAESFSNKARGTLLVMATGSGKTRTVIAIVDMLMKSGWITRALFLADRNALVTQAKNAFSEHLPYLTTVDITKEKEDLFSRMVFSTYPTLMNRIDGEKTEDNRFYGTGHFDLIIIDEAHRSVYMKYKSIFDYFDALLIGLTATPKSEVDKNTYELFGLEDHVPTYAYELDKAVEDKFLVPPKAISVPLKFQREGIKYSELSEEEKGDYELEFRDEETGSMPNEIGSSALNAWLFNKDTVDKVLGWLMEHGIKVEGGDKLGKTIIFARSHDHAVFIEKRFNENFKNLKGKFLRVIDNYEKYAFDLLDNFSTKEKYPQIAVSVDMLDTGIDIPEIVNLVFFKPVRSSSKFWQMIGRGTRLCEDLFAPGKDKKHFYIFDFCENFDFFEQFPDGVEPKVFDSLSSRIFKSRLLLAEAIREQVNKDEGDLNLRKQLLDILHNEISTLNLDSFIVRAKLRYVEKFKSRNKWDNLSKSDRLDISQNLAQLPEVKEEDEFARRFDLLMLNLQLAIISKDLMQKQYVNQVKLIGKSLSKKDNIPSVAKEMKIIKLIQDDDFWKTPNLFILDTVRESLRELIKFIDREKQRVVYTDFEDELPDKVEEKDVITTKSKMQDYRLRVEKYIREHQDHITIRKLKSNQPITAAELEELERILFDGEKRGTKKDFIKEYGEKPLGQFIRSIIGLERNAAMEAFSEFLAAGNLKADQLTFVNNIIDHLTQNGTIDSGMLFEPPFTDINDMGLPGVFNPNESSKIISIIKEINSNAGVA